MNRVFLNAEGLRSIALISPAIWKRFSRHQMLGSVYHEHPTSSNTLNRNQRCFRQFDRKTDCFDGGQVSQYASAGDLPGKSSRHRRYIVRKTQRLVSVRLWATFKAVCGTQTKQGGCLYEQPCSQI